MRPDQFGFSPEMARSTVDLPDPDFADNAETAAPRHGEADVLYHLVAAETDAQPIHGNHAALQDGSRASVAKRARG